VEGRGYENNQGLDGASGPMRVTNDSCRTPSPTSLAPLASNQEGGFAHDLDLDIW
jgi:hypothetical protein